MAPSATPILGPPTVSDAIAALWAQEHGATELFADLATLYWQYAPQVGIRPEVAYAQSAHETGFGRHHIDDGLGVDPTWRNPAGIKVARTNPAIHPDAPEQHQRFPDWPTGIRAHLAHLAAYAGLPAPPEWEAPRTAVVKSYIWNKTKGEVEGLSGAWAPSASYGQMVANLAADLIARGPTKETPVRIISRGEWGARPPKHITKMVIPRVNVWIHHGTGSAGPDPAAIVRGYQAYHMDSRGYSDIAYNFLVDQAGRIYEGRGWGIVGGHTLNNNSTSHAVCFVGDSDKHLTNEAVASIAAIIREGIRVGAIGSNPNIGGHRDAPGNSTSCPGDALERRLPEIRNLVAFGGGSPEEDDLTPEQAEQLQTIYEQVMDKSWDKGEQLVWAVRNGRIGQDWLGAGLAALSAKLDKVLANQTSLGERLSRLEQAES